MLVGLQRSPEKAGIPFVGPRPPIAASQRDPPALRAPAGREPARAPALRAAADRALVCFVTRPAAMRTGIASASVRASEAAALGAYVTVIANRTTYPSHSTSTTVTLSFPPASFADATSVRASVSSSAPEVRMRPI